MHSGAQYATDDSEPGDILEDGDPNHARLLVTRMVGRSFLVVRCIQSGEDMREGEIRAYAAKSAKGSPDGILYFPMGIRLVKRSAGEPASGQGGAR